MVVFGAVRGVVRQVRPLIGPAHTFSGARVARHHAGTSAGVTELPLDPGIRCEGAGREFGFAIFATSGEGPAPGRCAARRERRAGELAVPGAGPVVEAVAIQHQRALGGAVGTVVFGALRDVAWQVLLPRNVFAVAFPNEVIPV